MCINATIFEYEQPSCLKALMETPYFADSSKENKRQFQSLLLHTRLPIFFAGMVTAQLYVFNVHSIYNNTPFKISPLWIKKQL